MGSYLLHEPIACGLFDRLHSTAVGAYAGWPKHLVNSPQILDLLTDRMLQDFEAAHVKMRKAYSLKDLDLRW